MKPNLFLLCSIFVLLRTFDTFAQSHPFLNKTGPGVDVTVFNATTSFKLRDNYATTDGKSIKLTTTNTDPSTTYKGGKILYLHRLISNNSATISVKVDISNLTDQDAGIGLMAHSSLVNDGSYCKLYVTKTGSVIYETKPMGNAQPTLETIGNLTKIISNSQLISKTLLIKMCMTNGRVYFQIAHPNYTDAQVLADTPVKWLTVSNGFMLPETHFYGFFISPGTSNSTNIGTFSNFNVRKLEGSSGVSSGALSKKGAWWRSLATMAFFVLCPVTAITTTTTLAATGVAVIITVSATAVPLAGIAIPLATMYSTIGSTDRILNEVFGTGIIDVLEKIDPLLVPYDYDDPMRKYFVIKTTDPAQFKDLPFIAELKTAFVKAPNQISINGALRTTGTYTDANLTTLFLGIQKLATDPLCIPFTQSQINTATKESSKLNMTIYNLEVYASDAIYSYITGNPRKYTVDQYALYLEYGNYDILFNALSAIAYCKNAGEFDIKNIFSPTQKFVDIYQCVDATDALYNTGAEAITNNALGDKDETIQASARAILHLAILSFLDDQFYLKYNTQTSNFVRKATIYALRMRAAYEDNNIPMKVLSAASLYYSAHGNDYVGSQLDGLINDKFNSSGGYAEGTGYLEWLNQELIPYYYIAKKNGWMRIENPKIALSGKWLIDIADGDGTVSALDDAIPGTHWLAPYAYLNSDFRYKDYQRLVGVTGPDDFKKPDAENFNINTNAVVRFLTYPPQATFQTNGSFTPERVIASSGVAKLNNVVADTSVSLSLLYEDGQMLENGGAHDQQDGASISLRRKVGGAPIDELVIDPGYGGFGQYKIDNYQKQYKYHNTPQINTYLNGGVTLNSYVNLSDVLNAADVALDLNLGAVAKAISDLGLEFSISTLTGPLKFGKGITSLEIKSMGFFGAGGGPSSLTQLLASGIQSRINYDFTNDYANRTVQLQGNDYIVFDEIHSNQTDFSVFYNLPPNSAIVPSLGNNVVFGRAPFDPQKYTNANSSIRVSTFSENGQISANFEAGGQYGGTADPKGHPPVFATKTRFSVTGNSVTIGKFSIVSILEPRPGNFDMLSASYSSVVVPGASIALVKNIPEQGTVRYILVNSMTNGVASNISLKGITTDARFVVVDFASDRSVIQSIKATSGTFLKYYGKNIASNFGTGEFSTSVEIKPNNLTSIINLLLD